MCATAADSGKYNMTHLIPTATPRETEPEQVASTVYDAPSPCACHVDATRCPIHAAECTCHVGDGVTRHAIDCAITQAVACPECGLSPAGHAFFTTRDYLRCTRGHVFAWPETV